MKLIISDFKKIMEVIRDIMVENKDYLIKLDSVMGDGDLGLTMATGFNEAVKSVNDYDSEEIGMFLMKFGMAMNNAASSTMGTLVSSAIIRAAKSAKGKTEIDNQTYVEMAEAAVQGIMDRGKAKVGDKTILDSLVPAVEALKKNVEGGQTLVEAYKEASKAAAEGFEKTKDMVSQHGRAHYYGEKSKGNLDPGAAVAMLATEAICNYLNR